MGRMCGSPWEVRRSVASGGTVPMWRPDWSADWLHREATWLLDHWATATHGRPYTQLDEAAQALLRVRLKSEFRTNTYDPATGDLIVSVDRAAAISAVSQHYTALFGNDPALSALRHAYALPANSLKDAQRQRPLTAFFFWTA